MPDVGRLGVDQVEDPTPQLGLPAQVFGDLPAQAVAVTAQAPVDEQVGALGGVVGEQARQPVRHRISPPPAQLRVGAGLAPAQVGGQGGGPRLPQARVDRAQDRPGELVRVPGVVALDAQDQGDEGVRVEEPDARAHAVATPGGGPEPVREALGQPPLHPLGRHRDDLLGEGVRQGAGQELGQPVGQGVGAGRAVQVEGHVKHPNEAHRPTLAGRSGSRSSVGVQRCPSDGCGPSSPTCRSSPVTPAGPESPGAPPDGRSADAAGGPAGQPHQVGVGQGHDGVGGAPGGPDLVELLQLDVDQRA